jgi:hypothetical protein
MNPSLLAAWFWPKVSDRKNAQFAINEPFCVAMALAAITAMFATVEVLRDTTEGLNGRGICQPYYFCLRRIRNSPKVSDRRHFRAGSVPRWPRLRVGYGWPES